MTSKARRVVVGRHNSLSTNSFACRAIGFAKPEYETWGHKWAVGTRAELDAAGWAEESFPNEDADY